ncbi:MAG TPA: hypothetical protein VF439_02075 [Candidatus Paceibacterota bacterium]
MTRGTAATAVLTIAALAAPFLFPWAYAAVLAFALALAEPLAGIACGIIADALYYAPGTAHAPLGTALGFAGTLTAYLVRRFVKARIIGG